MRPYISLMTAVLLLSAPEASGNETEKDKEPIETEKENISWTEQNAQVYSCLSPHSKDTTILWYN